MKERPILFSAPMVQAILAGQKTQTRRIIKPQPPAGTVSVGVWHPTTSPTYSWLQDDAVVDNGQRCPYGQPGDRLWLREAWRTLDELDKLSGTAIAEKCVDAGYRLPWAPIQYEADGMRKNWQHTSTPPHDEPPQPGRYRHARFMPRWASRITLEITDVRAERLNDISEGDCWAEGIEAVDGLLDDVAIYSMAKRMGRSFEDAAPTYAGLWESINGLGSWAINPWVWVVSFRRLP